MVSDGMEIKFKYRVYITSHTLDSVSEEMNWALKNFGMCRAIYSSLYDENGVWEIVYVDINDQYFSFKNEEDAAFFKMRFVR